MYKPQVFIKGERLDLFDDENIVVVSSVQKIEDISRTFNDFSQSFTVPASPRNNRIFKHWYNFDVVNGFDSRIRHRALIAIQTIDFKNGSIKLESCKKKNGKPMHYKLTFFGQLIDLKKVIGEDYLSNLNLSFYDIEYSSDNVFQGLSSGFKGGDYIFPLISTKRQWLYNSNSSDVRFSEKLSNIAWNGSSETHGVDWTSLRPALLVSKIIESIQSDYSITFSNDFFSTNVFNDLYLWMANEDSTEALKKNYIVLNFNETNVYQSAIGSFNNATGVYSPTKKGAGFIRSSEIRVDSSDGVSYTVQLMSGDDVLFEESGTGDIDMDYFTSTGVKEGATIYLRIVSSSVKVIDSLNWRLRELSEDTVLFNTKNSFTIQGSSVQASDFMPKIKIMDFLKSIIKMYNLVVVPLTETSFYIDTLDSWYKKGKVYDISKYIETDEEDVSASKIFSEIIFKFQKPTTILAEQFNNSNNVSYGDLSTKLKDANGLALDGGVFEVETDFEQMVYEKLINLNNDSLTNLVYGLSVDGSISETVPEPHIFYARKVNVSSNPISVVNSNGNNVRLGQDVFMPSHTNSSSKLYSTVFGAEIDEHTGTTITNSLFEKYYKDYVSDSFSPQRRRISLKARLPLWLMSNLKLNDKLIIGANQYIINEMSVNVTTQIVDFDLLNDIYRA